MPAGMFQRPGMGSRTSSAPEGELHRLEAGRRPKSATKIGHALLEEDEGCSRAGQDTPNTVPSLDRNEEVLSTIHLTVALAVMRRNDKAQGWLMAWQNTGTLQTYSARGNNRHCWRGRCWQDELYQVCIGLERCPVAAHD